MVGTINLAPGSERTDYLLPLSQRTLDQVSLSAETVGEDLCVSSIDVGTFSLLLRRTSGAIREGVVSRIPLS